ncbi:MAG: hypothetical protein GYA87_00710 [Christensenellaceae bacterium]|nr:hypothetical protein [Christensenellaceae bacterium]
MTVKKARKIRNYLMITGLITMLLAYFYEPLFYIGIVITFSCLIPHFLYNKCPNCGKQLRGNEGNFCQYCGKRTDD